MADFNFTYHIFIAHSAADRDIAQQLYYSLSPSYEVFLDSVSLEPGDRWDKELAKAQAESLLTVVLISKDTEDSYYQRDEIATAIHLSRQKDGCHRVIPVYLSRGDVPDNIPYGLRVLQGIFIDDWADISKVGKKLRKTLNELENRMLMGDAGNTVRSVISALTYRRKSLIRRVRRRFNDAFQHVETPYLCDFFSDLAEKNTDDEFITALEEIGQTHREKKIPLSMVYMDVDGFSQINRKYDREAGDEVIKVIQRLFDGVFREHYFRKWGKDEFISFLSGVPEDSALELSNRLRDLIRDYDWESITPGLYVTASLGVAQLKRQERAIDWVVRTIHGSIYAKRHGGNKAESGPFILHQSISRKLSTYVS
jgi:diguanylate cyclase (GGDEF)-like protein